MLIIRLQRIGKKHSPQFRLVVAEKTRSVSKKFKEILGNYHPVTKKLTLKGEDVLKKYLDNNIQMSETAKSILVKNGHVKADKKPAKKVTAKAETNKVVEKAK